MNSHLVSTAGSLRTSSPASDISDGTTEQATNSRVGDISHGRNDSCPKDIHVSHRAVSHSEQRDGAASVEPKLESGIGLKENLFNPVQKSFENYEEIEKYNMVYYQEIIKIINNRDPNSLKKTKHYLRHYVSWTRFFCDQKETDRKDMIEQCQKFKKLLTLLPRELEANENEPYILIMKGLAGLVSRRDNVIEYFKKGYELKSSEAAYWYGLFQYSLAPSIALEALSFAHTGGIQEAYKWTSLISASLTEKIFNKYNWNSGERLSLKARESCEMHALSAAERGEYTFLSIVSDSYRKGTRGFPVDLKKANLYLEQAVNHKNAAAMVFKAIYLAGLDRDSAWRRLYSCPYEAQKLFVEARGCLISLDEEFEMSGAYKFVLGVERVTRQDQRALAGFYEYACELSDHLPQTLMEIYDLGCSEKSEKASEKLKQGSNSENLFWIASAISENYMVSSSDRPIDEALLLAMASFNSGFIPAATLVASLWERSEDNTEAESFACSQYTKTRVININGIQHCSNVVSEAHYWLDNGEMSLAHYAYQYGKNHKGFNDPKEFFACNVLEDILANSSDTKVDFTAALEIGSYRAHLLELRKILVSKKTSNLDSREKAKLLLSHLMTEESILLKKALLSSSDKERTIEKHHCKTPRSCYRALDLVHSGHLKLNDTISKFDLVEMLAEGLTPNECYMLRNDPGVDGVVADIIDTSEQLQGTEWIESKEDCYLFASWLTCDEYYLVKLAQKYKDNKQYHESYKQMIKAQRIRIDRAVTDGNIRRLDSLKEEELSTTNSSEFDFDQQLKEIKLLADSAGENVPALINSVNLYEKLNKVVSDLGELAEGEKKQENSMYVLECLIPYLDAVLKYGDNAVVKSHGDTGKDVIAQFYYLCAVASCNLCRHPEAVTYIELATKYGHSKAPRLGFFYAFYTRNFSQANKCLKEISCDNMDDNRKKAFEMESRCFEISAHPWVPDANFKIDETCYQELLSSAQVAANLGSGYGLVILAERISLYFEKTKEIDPKLLDKLSYLYQELLGVAVQMKTPMALKSMISHYLSSKPDRHDINPWHLLCATNSTSPPQLIVGYDKNRYPTLHVDTDLYSLTEKDVISCESREVEYQSKLYAGDSLPVIYLWSKTCSKRKFRPLTGKITLEKSSVPLINFLIAMKNREKNATSTLKAQSKETIPRHPHIVSLTLAQLETLGVIDSIYTEQKKGEILKAAAEAGYACALTCRGILACKGNDKVTALKHFKRAASRNKFQFPDTDAMYMAGMMTRVEGKVLPNHFLVEAANLAHPGAAALLIRLTCTSEKHGVDKSWYWTSCQPVVCLVQLWKKLTTTPAKDFSGLEKQLIPYVTSQDPLVLFYLLAMSESMPDVERCVNQRELLTALMKQMKSEHACWLMDHPDTPCIIKLLKKISEKKGVDQQPACRLIQLLDPSFQVTKIEREEVVKKAASAKKSMKKSTNKKKQRRSQSDKAEYPIISKNEEDGVRKKPDHPIENDIASYSEEIAEQWSCYDSTYCKSKVDRFVSMGDVEQALEWVDKLVDTGLVNRDEHIAETIRHALSASPIQIRWVVALVNHLEDGTLLNKDYEGILSQCHDLFVSSFEVSESQLIEVQSLDVLYQLLNGYKLYPLTSLPISSLVLAMKAEWSSAEISGNIASIIEAKQLPDIINEPQYVELCQHMVRNYRRCPQPNYDAALKWVYKAASSTVMRKNDTNLDLALVAEIQSVLEETEPDPLWVMVLFEALTNRERVKSLSVGAFYGIVSLLPDNLPLDSPVCRTGLASYLADAMSSFEHIPDCVQAIHVIKHCRTPKKKAEFARVIINSTNLHVEVETALKAVDLLLESGSSEELRIAFELLMHIAHYNSENILVRLDRLDSADISREKKLWQDCYLQCLALDEKGKNIRNAQSDVIKDIRSQCDELVDVSDMTDYQKWAVKKLKTRVQTLGYESENVIDEYNRLTQIIDRSIVRNVLINAENGESISQKVCKRLCSMDDVVFECFTPEQMVIVNQFKPRITNADEISEQAISVELLERELKEIKETLKCVDARESLSGDKLSSIYTTLSKKSRDPACCEIIDDIKQVCAAISLVRFSRDKELISNDKLWIKVIAKQHQVEPLQCSDIFEIVPGTGDLLCDRLAKAAVQGEWLVETKCKARNSRLEQLLVIWKLYGLSDEKASEWILKFWPTHQDEESIEVIKVDKSEASELTEAPSEKLEVLPKEGSGSVVSTDDDGWGVKAGVEGNVGMVSSNIKGCWDGVNILFLDLPSSEVTMLEKKSFDIPLTEDEFQSVSCLPASMCQLGVLPIPCSATVELIAGVRYLKHLLNQPQDEFDLAKCEQEMDKLLRFDEISHGSKYFHTIKSYFSDQPFLLKSIQYHLDNKQYHRILNDVKSLMATCKGDFLSLSDEVKADIDSALRISKSELVNNGNCRMGVAMCNNLLMCLDAFSQYLSLKDRIQKMNENPVSISDVNDVDMEIKKLEIEWIKIRSALFPIKPHRDDIRSLFRMLDYQQEKAEEQARSDKKLENQKRIEKFVNLDDLADSLDSSKFLANPLEQVRRVSKFPLEHIPEEVLKDLPEEHRVYILIGKFCSAINWVNARRESSDYTERDSDESARQISEFSKDFFHLQLPVELFNTLRSLVILLDGIQLTHQEYNTKNSYRNIKRQVRQAISDRLPHCFRAPLYEQSGLATQRMYQVL